MKRGTVTGNSYGGGGGEPLGGHDVGEPPPLDVTAYVLRHRLLELLRGALLERERKHARYVAAYKRRSAEKVVQRREDAAALKAAGRERYKHIATVRDLSAERTPEDMTALAFTYFVTRASYRPSAVHPATACDNAYHGRYHIFPFRSTTGGDGLPGSLTGLDDMHYRAALVMARLEQTIQPS